MNILINILKKPKRVLIIWALRLIIAGMFAFHGSVALSGFKDWIPLFTNVGISASTALVLLRLIGIADITTSILLVFKPMRIAIIWASLWPISPAIGSILSGQPVIHALSHYILLIAAGIILLYLRGFPKNFKQFVD